MITIDRMQELLEEIAEEVPEVFYRGLNGGILLLEDEMKSPEALDDDLYTLGQYVFDPSMGRYIAIYYGSFCKLFPNWDEAKIKEELKETLFHEFTHHVEALAGERGLEIKDQEELMSYLEGGGMYMSPPLTYFNRKKQ